jgi:NitT/TauT family transport system permease protein
MNDHNRLRVIGIRGLMIFIIFLIVILWEFITSKKIINPFYISQPTAIVADMAQFIVSGQIYIHLAITLQEAFLGLVVGTVVGIFFGTLLGRIRFLADLFEPIITALYGIPKLALAPIFILWFGLGIESKVFLSALLVFYLVFFSTIAGIRSVDPNIVASIKLMGANRYQLMVCVVLPSCIPWILTGIRGGIGSSLLGAIVGEYMGASSGLGWMIQFATTTYQIDRVMSCILILLIIGLVLNKGLYFLERSLLRWRPESN